MPDGKPEIYATIQGEGATMGKPVIFVRTSGCNLMCWVLRPGRGIPKVCLPNGKNKSLTKIKVGETILAISEQTGEIKETIVKDIIENTVSEYIEVMIEKIGTINLTAEHPLLVVKKGWVKAEDLKIGDKLEHIGGLQRNSYRMKKYNPMKNKIISEKMHNNTNYITSRIYSGQKSGVVRKEKGIIAVFSKQTREKMSQRMLGEKNPMKKADIVIKALQSRGGRYSKKSSYEIQTEKILKELGLENEVWFSGHGKYFVKDKSSKQLRVPDFKVHKQNKIIEVATEWFRRPDFELYKKEALNFYNRNGYDVLVLNGDDKIELQKIQLLQFIRNGLEVLKIKKFKDVKTYKNSKPVIKSYSTLNLSCSPYENYLTRTTVSSQAIINHNCSWCDTFYTWNFDNLKRNNPHLTQKPVKREDYVKEMSVDEVVASMENIGFRNAVFTGGEPVMQQNDLAKVAQKLREHHQDWYFEIETNGTIFINDFLAEQLNQINCSPKLVSSGNNPLAKNRPEAIKRLFEIHSKGVGLCFKFVVMKENWEQDLAEVKQWQKDCDVLNNLIWLMPEGITRDRIQESSVFLADIAQKEGYNLSTRLQVLMYGTRRAV